MEDIRAVKAALPVVALRGVVLFPGITLHFDVGREISIAAIMEAVDNNSELFLVSQIDPDDEAPSFEQLHTVGVICELKQLIKSDNNGCIRVIVYGKKRGRLCEGLALKPFIKAEVEEIDEIEALPSERNFERALVRKAKTIFGEYRSYVPKIAPDIERNIIKENRAGKLADIIAANIYFESEVKQAALSEGDPCRRLELVCAELSSEVNILAFEDDIDSRVQQKMDKSQREYYLHEQMKVISEELGEDGESSKNEAGKYIQRIKAAAMPEENRQKLLEECARFKSMAPSSPDANVVRTYLDRCLALPWGSFTKDNLNLKHARAVLDREHYGLEEVKERIIEMLASRAISPDIKGQIICLAGPPGVGKTSIAKSVAHAMGRRFQRISLGGVRDEAEIRGHRRTYIGAVPGRIVNALIDAKSENPLILLDEIDKLSNDTRGDPSSALLEVLDSEQNFSFVDHYIDLPFDLSKVLFITTANDMYAIPEPLRDRMEIIELYSYTHEEKFRIAKKHLIKKQMKEHSIPSGVLKISDAALRLMIDGYTREAGVRKLERELAKLCRKVTVRLAQGDNSPVSITPRNIESFLGCRKYKPEDNSLTNEIGLVNGLAWTSVGGEMLQIETAILDGSGKLELTGSLGDVMKESAHAAVTFVRSKADELKIDKEFSKTKDIHIHIPEGAVPKDGPSAGITMTTSLVSALTGIPVDGTVAMTGEVTLRGRVLPIGGLKEKSMAAYRAGISTVIIPDANVPDLEKIDEAVKAKLRFVPVKTVDEVLSAALVNYGGC